MKLLINKEPNSRLAFFYKQFTPLLFLLTNCFLYTNGQISIDANSVISENFNAIGSSATASLPANWKMSPAGTSAPTWNDANNLTNINFEASSGTPTHGGRYNWGKTGGTDRSIGFISSANYPSPNSIMAWCKNTGTQSMTSLTVSYDLYQFRIF